MLELIAEQEAIRNEEAAEEPPAELSDDFLKSEVKRLESEVRELRKQSYMPVAGNASTVRRLKEPILQQEQELLELGYSPT